MRKNNDRCCIKIIELFPKAEIWWFWFIVHLRVSKKTKLLFKQLQIKIVPPTTGFNGAFCTIDVDFMITMYMYLLILCSHFLSWPLSFCKRLYMRYIVFILLQVELYTFGWISKQFNTSVMNAPMLGKLTLFPLLRV